MLSKFGLENFNDEYITLYSPDFIPEDKPWDRIWATFLWTIGQGWGFDQQYHFYLQDYKTCTPYAPAVPGETICHAWNRHYGDWVKMGWIDSQVCFMQFVNTDWNFVEWQIRDVRLQRLWIYLYSQVWAGDQRRHDLFTDMVRAVQKPAIHCDTAWFTSGKVHNIVNKGVSRRPDYAPHYLKGNLHRGRSTSFYGKIKETND
jgi:hypothetical protein